MRRPLTYVICVAFALLLLTPALAGATTSTADQIAALQKAVAALQTLTTQQGQQIQALQTQVAAKHAIISGIVAPAASLGATGDFYVNSATSQLYGPKTCSGWGTPTLLIGPKGATGATGPAGPQGPKGATGATGAIGPAGPQGVKGDAGAMGPAGPAGHDGLDGANGALGTKGDTGTTGAQGPKGDTGATGDTGALGPKGDTGAAGAAGAAAATWYAATDAPADTLGTNGDLCLDRRADDVYQKIAGSWAQITNLKGPQGEKGDTGATGAEGPKGEKGDTGATGGTGAQGPKGDTGDTGPVGDIASNRIYAGLQALAPFVRVETGAVNGDSGPNIVISGANLFTETDSGAHSLLGDIYNPVPAAPVSLSQAFSDEGAGSDIEYHALLSWPASDSRGVVGYSIYRRDPHQPTVWLKLADVGADTLTYDDALITLGQDYNYAVTTRGSNGESVKTIASMVRGEASAVTDVQVLTVQPTIPTDTGVIRLIFKDKNGNVATDFKGTLSAWDDYRYGLENCGPIESGMGEITVYPAPGQILDAVHVWVSCYDDTGCLVMQTGADVTWPSE